MADPSKTATAVITFLQAVTVFLSPSTVSLAPSGTQQFTATVLGTSNTAVTWSINPSVGTISSAGMYTAPSSIQTSQTVAVTAQSVAQPTQSASGVVSLQTTPVLNQWSMGYYSATNDPAMPISAIQWRGLTHVAHAFAYVNADGTLNLTETHISTTGSALTTAAHTNNVKALLSIAQRGTDLQDAVDGHLSTLVSNIMSALSTYGYDGVDLDWEPFDYATNGDAMVALASALRTALGTNLLTTTIGIPDTWWGSHYSSFDRLNVMTYDQSGTYSWYHPIGVWYNSALYCNYPDSIFSCVNRFADILLTAGVPTSKLGIGIPFYGYKWQGGILESDHSQGISSPRQPWQTGHAPTSTYTLYNAILPQITAGNYHWDSVAVAPYINHVGASPSEYWYYTYDNPQSVKAKVQYAIAQGLGGWIIWAIGEDYMAGAQHPHPLLDAVQAGSAPAILSASALGSGTVGSVYSASLSTIGAAPVSWALSSGSLPNGLSLGSGGVISGTPTTAGTFTFIVTVGNFAASASQSFTIAIAAQ